MKIFDWTLEEASGTVEPIERRVVRALQHGMTWHRDDSMTEAITENGAYSIPLADSFYGGEAVLTDMQFDPEDGGRRFALGYTGAFFTVDGTHWSRMMSTTALPAHPTRAALDMLSDPCNDALYLTTPTWREPAGL